MKEYEVRMSADQDGDFVVIRVSLDDAEMTMRYREEESISIIAGNLDRILDYMWNEYLVHKEFKDQIENELDDWLKNGNDG